MGEPKGCACINGRYCYDGSRPVRCWIRDGKPGEAEREEAIRRLDEMDALAAKQHKEG